MRRILIRKVIERLRVHLRSGQYRKQVIFSRMAASVNCFVRDRIPVDTSREQRSIKMIRFLYRNGHTRPFDTR